MTVPISTATKNAIVAIVESATINGGPLVK